MSDSNENQTNETEANTEEVAADPSEITESAEPEKAGRFASLDKKKIAVGVGAAALAFAAGFGAAALFTGDDDGDRGRGDRPGMEKMMDRMMGDRDRDHHGGMGPGHGHKDRGGYDHGAPQWGQQMPQGMPPMMGPDSGGQTWSHGS